MSNKKRILFCVSSLAGGGAEKLLVQILKRFDYQAYDVYLYVFHYIGVYFDDIPPQVNWFTKETENGQLSQQFDIEVAFLEGSSTRYIGQRESNAYKIAWVHLDLLTDHWTKNYYSSVEEEIACYSRMHQIVFVSHDALTQFGKLFPQVETPRRVILNMIERDTIIANAGLTQIPKTKLTLCSVGGFHRRKAYPRLIPIIARLVYEDHLDFHFWLVGAGKQENLIRDSIEVYLLEEVVFLQGFHKNPYPFIHCADAFVSVSIVEGYPLVIAEALCLGKAIMATRVTGTREMLDDGKAGLLVDTDDESVYEGLKKIITSSELRDDLAKKAAIRSEIFDAEKTIGEIYRLFEL